MLQAIAAVLREDGICGSDIQLHSVIGAQKAKFLCLCAQFVMRFFDQVTHVAEQEDCCFIRAADLAQKARGIGALVNIHVRGGDALAAPQRAVQRHGVQMYGMLTEIVDGFGQKISGIMHP